jgi:hypothetical protein
MIFLFMVRISIIYAIVYEYYTQLRFETAVM